MSTFTEHAKSPFTTYSPRNPCFNPFPKTAFDDALLILKSQSAGGADDNAFTTILTPGFDNWFITKSGDHSVKATVSKAEDPYSETLSTHPNTPATENTFIRVIDK